MAALDIRTLLDSPRKSAALEPDSDRELLRRFATARDQAAFAELVRRHGPMVLRLCRRVLQGRDAEDVCQAAFLLLARQAGSQRWQASVNGWLFQVAYRMSLKARTAAARRSRHEARARTTPPADPPSEATFRELQAVFDEEISRLPEKYRGPILLCCLEGKSREEAARCLGWTILQVKDRLEEGRQRLRARLERRGLLLGTALLSTWVLGGWSPAADAGCVLPFTPQATAAAALAVATGRAALHHYLSPRLAALAQGATTTMFTRTLIIAAATLVILGLGTAGVVTAVQENPSPAKVVQTEAPAKAPATPPQQPQQAPAQPAVMPLAGHRGEVRALALDHDGKTLATAGTDKTVRIWDLATGRELQSLPFEGEPVGVAFSPDGKKVAAISSGDDRQAVLWNVDTGKAMWQHIIKAKGPISASAIAFSPDGKVFGMQVGILTHGMDVVTGKFLFTLQLGGKGPALLTFVPAGNLAIADGSGSIALADAGTGRLLIKVPGQRPVTALQFLSENKLAAADGGRALRVVDVTTGKQETALEGPEVVSVFAVAAKGKWAATASAAGTVILWDVAAGKQERRFTIQGPVHALALGPSGKLVITAGADGAMVWDMTRDEKPLPKDFKLADKDLDTVWADLASDEAGKAYSAARLLRADPVKAMPFLESHLNPKIDKPSPEKLNQLIADLDSEQFKKREAATKELEKIGPLAEQALRAALANKPALEMKNRLERLLKLLEPGPQPLTAAQQREVRAVRILESIDLAAARKTLETLAKESPTWWIRNEAQAALARLDRGGKRP
jgi:RNA polymerase sigma factor (sigma-70 family)